MFSLMSQNNACWCSSNPHTVEVPLHGIKNRVWSAISAYKIAASIVFKEIINSKHSIQLIMKNHTPCKKYRIILKKNSLILLDELCHVIKIFPERLRLLRSMKLFPLDSSILFGKFVSMEVTDCKIPGICRDPMQ
jgi:hypothetical protein